LIHHFGILHNDCSYQRHEKTQEQRLKERSKFNFQTKNKTKLCDSNKNTKIKNQNIICAGQMWKWIFIMLTYANMNMKITWQGYGGRLCLKLTLNKLKELKGPTPIYTPLGT
jgi:hypothetical protein